MLKIKLTVSDIPKEKIFIGQKGKYLTVIVSEMQQPDKYGNTHTVYIEHTKEEREAKAAKIYIGKGSAINFKPSSNPLPLPKEEEVDDLPF